MITWQQTIKVQASGTLSDESLRVGKDGVDADGIAPSLVGETADDAEVAVVSLPNGGTLFKFQNPFEMTEEDLSSEAGLKIDLVFNPNDIIKGWEDTSADVAMQDAEGHAIHVPMLDITPVAHAGDAHAVKESYLLHAPKYDVRIELYYIDTDENKTIYGADIKTIYTDETDDAYMDPMRVSFITTHDDDTLTFEDWQNTAIVSDFTRLANVEDTGTTNLACPEYMHIEECSESAVVDYELVSITTLE